MRIGVKGKQLCAQNHFTSPMHCDLTFNHFTPETAALLPNLCIVTLTLTPRSIGPILDSWGVCLWGFIRIGVKGKLVMHMKPFYLTHALWPWPLDPKVDRTHPWLMGNIPVMFLEDRFKGEAVMRMKPFYLTMHLQTNKRTDSSITPLTSLGGGGGGCWEDIVGIHMECRSQGRIPPTGPSFVQNLWRNHPHYEYHQTLLPSFFSGDWYYLFRLGQTGFSCAEGNSSIKYKYKWRDLAAGSNPGPLAVQAKSSFWTPHYKVILGEVLYSVTFGGSKGTLCANRGQELINRSSLI